MRAHCTAAESGMCSCGLHSRPSSVPFQVRLRALVGVEGGGEGAAAPRLVDVRVAATEAEGYRVVALIGCLACPAWLKEKAGERGMILSFLWKLQRVYRAGYHRRESTLLQGLLKMKLSSGKVQAWE